MLLAPLLIVGGAGAATPPMIEGRWLTDDGKAVIALGRCDRSLCGTISEILDKAPNVPATDSRNPDPRLRTRRLIGLPILTGFSQSGPVWKGGRAYDPKTGSRYRATLSLQGADRLQVTGCVLLFCQSRYWTRVRSSAQSRP